MYVQIWCRRCWSTNKNTNVYQERVGCIRDNPNFLENVIIEGESIQGFLNITWRQSSEWHTSDSPRPTKARISKSKVKFMLIVYFCHKGVVHKHCVATLLPATLQLRCPPSILVSLRLTKMSYERTVPRLDPDYSRDHNKRIKVNSGFTSDEAFCKEYLETLCWYKRVLIWRLFRRCTNIINNVF